MILISSFIVFNRTLKYENVMMLLWSKSNVCDKLCKDFLAACPEYQKFALVQKWNYTASMRDYCWYLLLRIYISNSIVHFKNTKVLSCILIQFFKNSCRLNSACKMEFSNFMLIEKKNFLNWALIEKSVFESKIISCGKVACKIIVTRSWRKKWAINFWIPCRGLYLKNIKIMGYRLFGWSLTWKVLFFSYLSRKISIVCIYKILCAPFTTQ